MSWCGLWHRWGEWRLRDVGTHSVYLRGVRFRNAEPFRDRTCGRCGMSEIEKVPVAIDPRNSGGEVELIVKDDRGFEHVVSRVDLGGPRLPVDDTKAGGGE